MYDLKNTQNSKLICIKLTKAEDYSLLFYSYSNNQLKNIGKYKAKGLLFNFHSEAQKLFIINPLEGRFSSMKIDSLERIIGDTDKIIKK